MFHFLRLKTDVRKMAFKMEEKVVFDFALDVLPGQGDAQATECPAKRTAGSRVFFLKSSISLHKSFPFFLEAKKAENRPGFGCLAGCSVPLHRLLWL